jgi:hypothetical protein
MMEKIRSSFKIASNAEVTLEANPDDITEEKLQGWKEAGINRLSIGIQSFFRRRPSVDESGTQFGTGNKQPAISQNILTILQWI